MMLRWLCCSADVRLLVVLFNVIGVVDTSDEACVVVILLALDVFVCSSALEDGVVVVTTADAHTVVSATVDVAVLSYHTRDHDQTLNTFIGILNLIIVEF